MKAIVIDFLKETLFQDYKDKWRNELTNFIMTESRGLYIHLSIAVISIILLSFSILKALEILSLYIVSNDPLDLQSIALVGLLLTSSFLLMIKVWHYKKKTSQKLNLLKSTVEAQPFSFLEPLAEQLKIEQKTFLNENIRRIEQQ